MEWVAWRAEMSRLVVRFCAGFERRFGYSPGGHVVGGPTPAEQLRALAANGVVDVPEVLIEFYQHVAEVSLPDLNNGYFIHSASRVAQGLHLGGDVIQVVHDSFHAAVVQIGSDGSGGLYALEREPARRVIYLPVGELREGVYTGNPVTPPRVAASKLDDLLLDWEGGIRTIVAEMAPN